jgi:Bacterial regulatory protein, Fis family
MNKNAITKSQMADELGFSLRTLQRKLDKAGLKVPRGLIGSDTQNLIKIKLGQSQIILIDNSKKIK